MADLLRVKLQAPLTGFPSIQTFNLIELKDTALACQSPEPAKLSPAAAVHSYGSTSEQQAPRENSFPSTPGTAEQCWVTVNQFQKITCKYTYIWEKKKSN